MQRVHQCHKLQNTSHLVAIGDWLSYRYQALQVVSGWSLGYNRCPLSTGAATVEIYFYPCHAFDLCHPCLCDLHYLVSAYISTHGPLPRTHQKVYSGKEIWLPQKKGKTICYALFKGGTISLARPLLCLNVQDL